MPSKGRSCSKCCQIMSHFWWRFEGAGGASSGTARALHHSLTSGEIRKLGPGSVWEIPLKTLLGSVQERESPGVQEACPGSCELPLPSVSPAPHGQG